MITTFISTFLLWACVYYAIWRWEPRCFLGFSSFLSAFLFSIETQNTIGECTHPAATSGAFGYAGWLTGCWRYRMTVHACASAAESTGAATHHTLLLSPQCPTSCCLLAPPPTHTYRVRLTRHRRLLAAGVAGGAPVYPGGAAGGDLPGNHLCQDQPPQGAQQDHHHQRMQLHRTPGRHPQVVSVGSVCGRRAAAAKRAGKGGGEEFGFGREPTTEGMCAWEEVSRATT